VIKFIHKFFRKHNFLPCLAITFPFSFQKLTPWSTTILENLIVTQLVKKFSAFYGTRIFPATPRSSTKLYEKSYALSNAQYDPYEYLP